MLGDISQPQLVSLLGREISFDEIIMNRRTWLPIQSALLGKHRPDTLKTTEALDPVLSRHDAVLREFIGDEPIPNAGSSAWTSNAALIRCASAQSRSDTGLARQR